MRNHSNITHSENVVHHTPDQLIVKHIYDIDLTLIDPEIKKSNTTLWHTLFGNICKEQGIPEQVIPGKAILVNSDSESYILALAFYITSIKPWEIGRFLDYQNSEFDGNYHFTEYQFTNMLEYYLVNILPVMDSVKRHEVLKTIYQWIGNQPEPRGSKKAKEYTLTKKMTYDTSLYIKKALEELKIFSGLNHFHEKIMTDDDYQRLFNYTIYLITKNELPKNIKPIPRINLPNQFIIYTFYRIHQIIYGKKRQAVVFIFLHRVFSQFKDISLSEDKVRDSYLYKRFSSKPTTYDSDIKNFSFQKGDLGDK